jgi:hypothetical protein
MPTIKYGLSATIIQKKWLEKSQSPLIYEILPKIGYNRHVPRALAYATTAKGGIGLQYINSEQGKIFNLSLEDFAAAIILLTI